MSKDTFQEYEVCVDNPQKHLNPMETYISFRVTTLMKQGESSEKAEYVVRRRYNDFLWLRKQLIESFPVLLVPALPAKHSVLEQLDRYSRSFVLSRMAMLHSYLQRLASHPVFSCSPALKIFLTAKSTEFVMHSSQCGSSGILERLTGSFHTFSGCNLMSNSLYPEFIPVKQYVCNLGQKLAAIHAVSNKIHKERLELSTDFDESQRAINQWACLEPQLSCALTEISNTINKIAASQQKYLINDYSSEIDYPMEEYLNYIEAIKEALSRRDAIQLTYENNIEESNRKRLEKEQLEILGITSKELLFKIWRVPNQNRIRKLEEMISALDRIVEESHDSVEIANESIKADIERWNIEKVSEMKGILGKLVEQHVHHYQESLNSWEKALETIKGIECEPKKPV